MESRWIDTVDKNAQAGYSNIIILYRRGFYFLKYNSGYGKSCICKSYLKICDVINTIKFTGWKWLDNSLSRNTRKWLNISMKLDIYLAEQEIWCSSAQSVQDQANHNLLSLPSNDPCLHYLAVYQEKHTHHQ